MSKKTTWYAAQAAPPHRIFYPRNQRSLSSLSPSLKRAPIYWLKLLKLSKALRMYMYAYIHLRLALVNTRAQQPIRPRCSLARAFLGRPGRHQGWTRNVDVEGTEVGYTFYRSAAVRLIRVPRNSNADDANGRAATASVWTSLAHGENFNDDASARYTVIAAALGFQTSIANWRIA